MFGLLMRGRARFFEIAAEFDLSPIQAHVLNVLDETGPLPMHAVADRLHCDASNVTGLVDRLEDRGLIERRAAAHDRRVKIVALTEEGGRLRERLSRRMFEPPSAIAGLSVQDQRTLRDVLRRAVPPAD